MSNYNFTKRLIEFLKIIFLNHHIFLNHTFLKSKSKLTLISEIRWIETEFRSGGGQATYEAET
jgi:hypothetical protein